MRQGSPEERGQQSNRDEEPWRTWKKLKKHRNRESQRGTAQWKNKHGRERDSIDRAREQREEGGTFTQTFNQMGGRSWWLDNRHGRLRKTGAAVVAGKAAITGWSELRHLESRRRGRDFVLEGTRGETVSSRRRRRENPTSYVKWQINPQNNQ